ncbi:MAG: hypothetical protein HY554_16040 [Elusimicrobia bacterium]|nr:hypothetical protein [Elusimicrobiota bacterium]
MRILALLLTALLTRPANGAIFNDVVPGAKPMGMGMAYTAVADDPYAIFYNPGGLAGSDFPALSMTVGRMFSPVGPLGYTAASYTRPFPLRQDGVVGAAFLTLREGGGGAKDQFTFHYSEPVALPQLYLAKPLKVGVNAKIVSIDGGSKGAKRTLGADGGVLVESNIGLKGGLAILDLMSDVGLPNPTIALGTSYLVKDRITVAGDLRLRKGLLEFYPGLEASFYQGLLKARMGKGIPLQGIPQVALGAGANFSPVVVDFAMTIPFSGFVRNGGSYQMSVSYRFGAPPFYGRFVGSAARHAEDLKSQLLELEDRKRTLDSQVTSIEANKLSLEGQVRSMEGRARSLQEQVRSLELRADERRFELDLPKTPRVPAPVVVKPSAPPPKAAPAPFPRKHAVSAGETLRSIASQHYGDPSLWELVYQANPTKIDRGLPREGELLLIPAPK